MIDWILRRVVTRIWRWRIARREQQRDQWTIEFMEWKSENPDRCMYCAYTAWARNVQGVKMALDPHHCIEGNSPPQPLPRAKVLA